MSHHSVNISLITVSKGLIIVDYRSPVGHLGDGGKGHFL